MIEVNGVWAGYGGAPVLRGIDLHVGSGEFVGILGPNACGKSTLLKALTGTLATQEGSVRMGSMELGQTPARETAREVASVPQSTVIPFPFTGFEVVMMGRYPRMGRFARETGSDLAAVQNAMGATDTTELAERLITQVSGGERQRLVLARALAQETSVLMLDEATASMDIHRKIDAFDLLAGLNRDGVTVLAVMHDLNLAALYCRRLLFMKAGRIHADGPTAEVFTEETIRGVYDTPVQVSEHPATRRPHAVFLPRRQGPGNGEQ